MGLDSAYQRLLHCVACMQTSQSLKKKKEIKKSPLHLGPFSLLEIKVQDNVWTYQKLGNKWCHTQKIYL